MIGETPILEFKEENSEPKRQRKEATKRRKTCKNMQKRQKEIKLGLLRV
jgi:hypothetical protein